MASKDALLVLNDCIDQRSGRRFAKGDRFDPMPSVEQARKLVAARCLPDDAIPVAEKAEADAEKSATKAENKRKAEIAAVRKAKEEADATLVDAKAALEAATSDQAKTEAQSVVDAAKAKVEELEEELRELEA